MHAKKSASAMLLLLAGLVIVIFARAKGWLPIVLACMATGCASGKYPDDPVDNAGWKWNKWKSENDTEQWNFDSSSGKWEKTK